jgi:hypothetical protein
MRVWCAAALVLGSVAQVGWGQFAGSTDESGHTRLSPVAKTVSLGEVRHSVETVADVSKMKYENGYFVSLTDTGGVKVLDKDGRTTVSFYGTLVEDGAHLLKAIHMEAISFVH